MSDTDLPTGWRETYKRRPRVAYLRNDGAAILKDGPERKWSIRKTMGGRPEHSAQTLAEAIAWADVNITETKEHGGTLNRSRT